MIELLARLASDTVATDRLVLPFERRQKSRQRVLLASGREAALKLARGTVLRGGDRLSASDGGVIAVEAMPEDVLHVICTTPRELARAAYHLGNRHVAVEVGAGYLRLCADHVLEQMLRGLGVEVSVLHAPFEPEAGAYGGGHHHHDEAGAGTARIHEYPAGAGTPSAGEKVRYRPLSGGRST